MSFNETIYKLRKLNRDLFDQLETNSVLLENKLRKLKENARSSKDFLQSYQNSSLKKRRRSWKMRNDSGQVFEMLNSKRALQSSSNDNTPQAEMLQDEDKTKQLMMTKSSVKSKRKKSVKGTKNSFTPYRNTNTVSQVLNYSESDHNPDKDKRNEFLYNTVKDALQIDHKNKHLTDEENVTLSKPRTLNVQSRKNYVPDRIVNDKLLQEVGNIIDYTPKSTFLQRLKERSQRNGCHSNGSPRKAVVYSESQTPAITSLSNTLKKDIRRTVLSTRENQMKSSLKEAAKSCGCCSPCVCACNIPVSNAPTLKKKEVVPPKQKKNRKHVKKKRVCYRRNCYCRKPPQGAPSGNKKTSAKKENRPYIANEVDRSPKTSSVSYRQRCNLCSSHSTHPKADNAKFGHISSARAPQESLCYCTCQETGSWFNALRKFRDSHWFDCHAKPISICLDPNKHRILQNHCKCYQEDEHTCVHQYVVNDRLFMEPVCADHKGRSRCVYCKLPRNKDRTSNFTPSKPSKEEVLVSLPLNMLSPERNKNYILSNKRDESKKAPYKRSIRIKRSPPPANSLALRFQKGIL